MTTAFPRLCRASGLQAGTTLRGEVFLNSVFQDPISYSKKIQPTEYPQQRERETSRFVVFGDRTGQDRTGWWLTGVIGG